MRSSVLWFCWRAHRGGFHGRNSHHLRAVFTPRSRSSDTGFRAGQTPSALMENARRRRQALAIPRPHAGITVSILTTPEPDRNPNQAHACYRTLAEQRQGSSWISHHAAPACQRFLSSPQSRCLADSGGRLQTYPQRSRFKAYGCMARWHWSLAWKMERPPAPFECARLTRQARGAALHFRHRQRGVRISPFLAACESILPSARDLRSIGNEGLRVSTGAKDGGPVGR
jgi:hypothetical protein